MNRGGFSTHFPGGKVD